MVVQFTMPRVKDPARYPTRKRPEDVGRSGLIDAIEEAFDEATAGEGGPQKRVRRDTDADPRSRGRAGEAHRPRTASKVRRRRGPRAARTLARAPLRRSAGSGPCRSRG